MKSVTNDSLQSFEIYFTSPKGTIRKWLKPKETVVVPKSYISEQVQNMHNRRVLRIRNA